MTFKLDIGLAVFLEDVGRLLAKPVAVPNSPKTIGGWIGKTTAHPRHRDRYRLPMATTATGAICHYGSRDARRWCLEGAIRLCSNHSTSLAQDALNAIRAVLRKRGWDGPIWQWNDWRATSLRQVSVLAAAAKAERKKYPNLGRLKVGSEWATVTGLGRRIIRRIEPTNFGGWLVIDHRSKYTGKIEESYCPTSLFLDTYPVEVTPETVFPKRAKKLVA